MTERLLLVGMMAVGKTTVGQLCATKLGWTFLDSDAQLVVDTGRTAQEIFETDGDETLRSLESRVLAEAIAHPVPVVVAVAGGAVLAEPNRLLLMRSGVVVWLRASIETLSERVRRGGARPRLGDDQPRLGDNRPRLCNDRLRLCNDPSHGSNRPRLGDDRARQW